MKVAWLFPGQGSQVVGMGRSVAAASAAAQDVFARADAALGEPLSALCFEGPLDTLTLTVNAQPALVATSAALVAALRERWPELGRPAIAAGHSLGEYSALVAAGALGLEDAVRLCRARGLAMQEVVPPGVGAMAAIMGLDEETLNSLCAQAAEGEVVCPANFNAPGQIVVAGHASAVARLGALVAERRGKLMPLKVSAPFHSPLMRPAAERMAAELAKIPFRAPDFPVFSNIEGSTNTDPKRLPELLTRQVDGAVQWTATVSRMAQEGVTHALEIGPGKVLANLVKRIAKDVLVLGVDGPEAIEQVPAFLERTRDKGSSLESGPSPS